MIFLDETIRDAQADVVRQAAINGSLVIKSGQGQALVTINMGPAPFNAPSGGGVSIASPKSGTAALTGKATYFELFRNNSTLMLRGSVGNAAGDILLESVNITAGETVNVNALSYFVPPA